jgi:DNA recombination-dependent growth factor C
MSFLKSSASFTRFRILEDIPKGLWEDIPARLKQYAFHDIDDTVDERAWGWTNFDDMLDTGWRLSPPEKGAYITFSLRLDTRRIPPSVFKKHIRLAVQAEEAKLRGLGKNFVSRDRKLEIKDQVKTHLMKRFLPIPAEFQVIWATRDNMVYVASTQEKLLDLFLEHFALTFELRLEQLTPFVLALRILGEDVADSLDFLEPTSFV